MKSVLVDMFCLAMAFKSVFWKVWDDLIYPQTVVYTLQDLFVSRLKYFLWWLWVQLSELEIRIWTNVFKSPENIP